MLGCFEGLRRPFKGRALTHSLIMFPIRGFDELEGLASDLGDVTIARFDSDAGARIDAQAIKRDLGGELGNWSFYLCGPRPMVAAVSEGLRRQRVSARHIHNEEFELR